MNSSYYLMLGYVLWMFILLLAIASLRFTSVYRKQHGLRFKADGSDLSALAQRLSRAHANCYENLPMVTAVILVAAMTGNIAVTNFLALYFLGLRVMQSLIHVTSTSNTAILLRFICYLLQCGILVYWLYQLFMAR